MASQKLSALVSLAGGQVPTDLAYVVDVSAGAAGSKKSTLNDLFAIITKNITDGAVRFQGFAAPAVSAAGAGSIYFDSTSNSFKASENAGAYFDVGNVRGPALGTATDNALARWDTATGRLIQNSLITMSDAGALSFPDDVRQVFNPGANVSGLNVGALAGDPSTPINGDLWYDSTGGLLRARINGASVTLGTSVPGGADTEIQRNNAGAFGGVTGATSNGTSITFTSNNLIATSPRLITGINDSAGNEFWTLTGVGSAINELNYRNAAAGDSPMWTATGGDSNIGFWITPKGSGDFRLFDPANGVNLFAIRQLGISQFPRTLFQGGESTNDTNWVMRFADFYSSSGQNINVGVQLSTNNDANYSNAETLFFLTTTTNHYIFSVSGSSNSGVPIQITTDANLGTTPNLYCDTVANGSRVGVATNAPTAQLHVLSGATSRVAFRANNPSGSTALIASFEVNGVPFVAIDSSANAYFGNGITNAAPATYILNATGGSGTNIAGANLDLAGGKGTGNATPGLVSVRYPLVGSTGTTLQSLSTARFPVKTNFYLNYSTTTTVANTTTETSLLGAADFGTDTIEAGLGVVGRLFHFNFRGTLGTNGLQTLTIRLKLGGTTLQTWTSAAVTVTASGWELDVYAVITAIGSTGNIRVEPSAFRYSTGTVTGQAIAIGSSNTTIDFTVNQQWSLTAQWGAADPANSLTYNFGNGDIGR